MADSPPPPFFAAGTAADLSRPADYATHPAGVVVEIVGTLMATEAAPVRSIRKTKRGAGSWPWVANALSIDTTTNRKSAENVRGEDIGEAR